MADCTHDCSSCNKNCGERTLQKEKQNEFSSVKKIYAVISGKGGVGKSLITSLLAVEARRRGKTVAILDADLTGPSIPKAFGVTEKARGSERGILPVATDSGIKLMSINLLLENDSDPVVWRGPVIAGTVKQFYTDVVWGDTDIMFVDCPPGTGDVPLTVFQSLPIDGIIVVASPQELVSMIMEKA
ncbi:MAG: P-loop NTPase, partial [Clostridia bacterium]|nr:P-loop NTPase [Clostridia bacterium]